MLFICGLYKPMSFYLARYIYSSQNVIKFVHLKMLYSPICACAQRSPLFVSARSARYYAIEFVCGCVGALNTQVD